MSRPSGPASPRRSIAVAVAVAALVGGPVLADPVREAMGGVFGAMRVLLPLSAEPAGLSAKQHAAEVKAALELLDKSAQKTASHMTHRSADDAAEISRALEEDVRRIRARYAAGDVDGAGFLVRQLSQRCVACHLRLPKKVDSPLSGDFVDGSHLGALAPHVRAPLQVAVRQFDEALTTWEQAFTAPALSREALQAVEDYLATAVRGRRDHHRHAFQRPATLDEARRLLAPSLREGTPRAEQPLVDALIASAKLQSMIDAKALRDEDLAEGLMLLGLAQARAGGEERALLAPASLEAAVRVPRGGAFRQQAYDALEQLLSQEHQGTSGDALPADVAARLGELRALLGAPATGPSPAHGRMP
jgi:mono/diheme cytochrome c family protein